MVHFQIEESQAETAVLCTTASPKEGTTEQATGPVINGNQQVLLPAPVNPYDDIPFKLSPVLVADQVTGDVGNLCHQLTDAQNSYKHRYNYDFQLERGVVRDSDQ